MCFYVLFCSLLRDTRWHGTSVLFLDFLLWILSLMRVCQVAWALGFADQHSQITKESFSSWLKWVFLFVGSAPQGKINTPK